MTLTAVYYIFNLPGDYQNPSSEGEDKVGGNFIVYSKDQVRNKKDRLWDKIKNK